MYRWSETDPLGTRDASDSPSATYRLNGRENSTIRTAPILSSYANFSGYRFAVFDDYSVTLDGGSTFVEAGAPVVSTTSTAVASDAVTFTGNLASANGGTISDLGFVYSTSAGPTVADTKVSVGSSPFSTGAFSGSTSTLAPGTYYFRSFAQNKNGISYGVESSVVIPAPPSGDNSSSDSETESSNPTPAAQAPAPTPQRAAVVRTAPNTDPVSNPVERSSAGFDPEAPARATIGGIATPLIEIPGGPDGFSFTAGAFQFGVTVNGGNSGGVDTDTPSSPRELFVPSGQPAVVSGGGSYPGSFVQLWLPGNGTEPRELSRIQVGPDGTFGSDLTFDGPTSGAPVPIGRQVLQVVGYDEEGNQTVVDMTINIGQGAPAPEPNRQVGELPALSAGQSLATSGGMPQDVSVTGLPEAGNVVVEGPDWVVNVNADRDNGVVETDDGQVLVRFDQSSVGTASGSGFMAGTLASVWLFSEPTLMATVTVDDNGEFSSEFLVDARLIAPGEHTLQVQGVGQDGLLKAANLGVVVEQPVVLTSEGASSWLFWVVGVLLLALLLILFFFLARRRRSERASQPVL